MPRPVPGTGPDDGGQAASPAGGAFPPADRPASCAGDPAPSFDGYAPGAGGTAWPDGQDYQALLDGLAASGFLDGRMEDQDAVLAEEIAAAEEDRMLPADSAWVAGIAALAAEYMEPGPSQAGWLEVATAEAGRLDENALAGLAAGAQKLVSRGQAMGLAAAAQITARAAAADPRIGVAASDGRPVRLCQDGLKQIGLALMLTDHSAGAWADLAVTLAWRLPATGRALGAGVIDYWRARLIANATSVLPEDKAREVEEKILPRAGKLTTADLRDRLHWAVIAADPDGAERRRKAEERQADVRLYPDDDQTATLHASKLPQIESAAGYARVSAMAKARMAAGFPGTLGFNRSQVLLGLMLDTLPPIPPAEGAPPDDYNPGDGGPNNGGPGKSCPDGNGPGRSGPGHGDCGDGGSGQNRPGHGPGDEPQDPNRRPQGSGPDRNGLGRGGPGRGGTGRGGSGDGNPGQDRPGDDPAGGGPWDDLPAPRDEDAPPDDGLDELVGQNEDGQSWDPAEEDDDPFGTGPAPQGPALGVIPPALRSAASQPVTGRPADGRPIPGLLDVTLPWVTLTGTDARPGTLGRIGAITPVQARQLAQAAETDPAAHWRIIITNDTGQAIAVTRIRRRNRSGLAPPYQNIPPGTGPPGTGPPPGTGLVGRITLTISEDTLAQYGVLTGRRRVLSKARGEAGSLSAMAVAGLRAARRPLERARAQKETDRAAGGCAHGDESAAYRPPPRLREFVIARDVTCRNPACRQPAWRADLDHTIAFERCGRTCRCNLGGACRRDHRLKQHPRWKLEQTRPGEFTWTTPAGRKYTTTPDVHPV
ncbi:MAG TPA: DUF222 domain-containing protein [Streptosporangiaceae bacterium]|nr:DUF222 domain-containing protein [Streptosporangiaceae bacterium]